MKITLSVILLILCSTPSSAQWNNPENQMLSDSMTSFFYYSINNNVPFSDPRSLSDTERRSMISDNYYNQLDYELEYTRQTRQRYTTKKSNYKLHYLHRKNLK